MIAFPPCKINLGLHVVSKRADGYHNLVTCFYPVPWCDVLEIIPANELLFTSSGLPVPGDEKQNLCIKAYHLLKKDFHIKPVRMHLHKIIPVGAGLGGGSSDGAWTLRLLNTIFELGLTEFQLRIYASGLGSDCSFFIGDDPLIGKGRGEQLSKTSVSLQNNFLVLVKPELHISTAEAYSGVTPKLPDADLQRVLEQTPIDQWKEIVKNDFEDSVFKKFPAIAKIKAVLYANGARYASMSGSGSAVFGIFTSPVDVSGNFPGMSYWSGMLHR